MKDYIDVYNGDKKETMEIVLSFNLEGYNDNYIIYKTLNNSHYYLAKHQVQENNTITKLNTDISDHEYHLAQKIFEGAMGKCS